MQMTDARNDILARLRSSPTATLSLPDIPVRRFDWDAAQRLQHFQQRMQASHTEVYQVDNNWPGKLAELLRDRGMTNLRYGAQGPLARELTGGWPTWGARLIADQAPIEQQRDALFGATDAGFTSCRAGIAETGSLVLWPTPAEPRLLSLVPPVHCVLLEAGQIVSTLHELMHLEHWHAGMPTNALLISGPSKSADIEQTLAYGVHGPAQLLVLIRTPGSAGNA
jgi:L-lactate dehydrogenase complex protein LldG